MFSLTKKSWSNWSGSQISNPIETIYPQTEEELQNYFKSNREQKYRVVGSGHSFSALVPTDSILISLDKMQGIIDIDAKSETATVWAGTKLHTLAAELHANGLALINMGDIDRQSIAGALCSGTHGTGVSLGILSTAIIEMTIVKANGDILLCNKNQNAEIFELGRVNLGILGIVTKLKLKVMKKFKLQYQSHKESLADCLNLLPQRVKANRHYEFFWFPYSNTVQSRISNITQEQVSEKNPTKKKIDDYMENNVFDNISKFARLFPSLSPFVAKICAFFMGEENRINYSHRIFANLRDVKFQEMELSVPIEFANEAILKVDETIRKHKVQVHFPIEVRFTAEDDIALSPCYKRTSCFIAFHMYKGMPYESYFRLMEKTLDQFGCRPHWGKMTFLGKEQLKQKYPKFEQLFQLRKELDPKGQFLNEWLENLFLT